MDTVPSLGASETLQAVFLPLPRAPQLEWDQRGKPVCDCLFSAQVQSMQPSLDLGASRAVHTNPFKHEKPACWPLACILEL